MSTHHGRSHVSMPDGEIAKEMSKMLDLRPKAIERTLKLRQPMYLETAAYGHDGTKERNCRKDFQQSLP